MEISAALVKELRERTGSGMMECKKALAETGGDLEKAIDLMRKSGMAKADKKAGRTAAEGRVVVVTSDDQKSGAMAEVNCETDFVAKGDDFVAFAEGVARRALALKPATVEALMALPLKAGEPATIDEVRRALVAKLGENITVRRMRCIASASGRVGAYSHGARIGVMVEVDGGDAALAKDIAMHIAASKPVAIDEKGVSAEAVEKEKEIYRAQAAESGKPADIVEKMIAGRVQKYLREITLLGQPFVKNPDQTIAQLLKDAKATVKAFDRYEAGEGIEKKSENFAQEVMAQVRGG